LVRPDRVLEILKQIPDLPGTAMVPVAVAAAHDHVSSRTVRRRYELIQLSPGRMGVRVEFLRTRKPLKQRA
jgi:hypothetical protein